MVIACFSSVRFSFTSLENILSTLKKFGISKIQIRASSEFNAKTLKFIRLNEHTAENYMNPFHHDLLAILWVTYASTRIDRTKGSMILKYTKSECIRMFCLVCILTILWRVEIHVLISFPTVAPSFANSFSSQSKYDLTILESASHLISAFY